MDKGHELAVVKAEDDRAEIVKVHFVSEKTAVAKGGATNSLPYEDKHASFESAGALVPPHSPETLCMLLEHSNALRQNIDAYQTNIDGFGYKLEPVIDPMAEDADERIANAIFVDRVAQGSDKATMPTDKEVEAAKEKLVREMRQEKARVNAFFDFCCADSSFITHRRKTRQDIEVTGNSYWEIVRNKGGKIAQFTFVPSHTMRLMPQRKKDCVVVQERVRVSELSLDVVERPKQFRRYVQIIAGNTSGKVYFKELGDERVMSRRTGETFVDEDALKAAEDPDGLGLTGPATEMLHFKIHSPRSSYGVPRWIGALLAVLGNRQAEEVNFMYFENKSVPPLAVLVSGGRMTDEAVTRIQDFVDNEIKGKKNFHKILFIEADSNATPNSGQVKIEIKPLTQAQQSDALFQNYDERNIDKVGQSFRLPRMLRGDIRDFNRSTAEAALLFAEMQVFQPEREEFDWTMNRKILTDLGIRFWKFTSLGPISKDPARLSEMIRGMVRDGIILPGEARNLAEDVFNKPFPQIDEFWANQPLVMTASGFIPEEAFDPATRAEPNTPPAERDTKDPKAPKATGGASDGKEAADTSTDDLKAGGKKKKKQPRKFRRLPPIEKDELFDSAKKLIQFRNTIHEAELQMASDEFMATKADVDDDANEG